MEVKKDRPGADAISNVNKNPDLGTHEHKPSGNKDNTKHQHDNKHAAEAAPSEVKEKRLGFTTDTTNAKDEADDDNPVEEGVTQPKRKSLRRKSVQYERRKSISLMLARVSMADKKPHTAIEFDGVHWRTVMKNYFRESAKRWPPKHMWGLFWTKGYYKEWADDCQKHSRYFSKYLDNELSDDELTKVENEAYRKAQEDREKGLPEAQEWESYDSEDSAEGKMVRKLRRKSLEHRHPELWNSHDERRKVYEHRKDEKSRLLEEGKHFVLPHYSPFIGLLNKSHPQNEDDQYNTDLAKYLAKRSIKLPGAAPSAPRRSGRPKTKKSRTPTDAMPQNQGASKAIAAKPIPGGETAPRKSRRDQTTSDKKDTPSDKKDKPSDKKDKPSDKKDKPSDKKDKPSDKKDKPSDKKGTLRP